MREAAIRQKMVSQINANVMKAVRKASRKSKCRSALRLVVFCFGVPLLLFLPALALFIGMEIKLSAASTIAVGVSLLFFYVPVVRRLNEIFRQPTV